MKTEINSEGIHKVLNKAVNRYKKEAATACALMDCIMDEEEINSDEVIATAADKLEVFRVSFGLICDILAKKNYIKRDSIYGVGDLFSSKEDLDSDYMSILKTAYASLKAAERFLIHMRYEKQVLRSDYISYIGIFSGAGLVMHETLDAAYELPDAASK